MAQIFAGKNLIRADGSKVSPDVLKGKVVGILFSAHWCPPCRGFAPVLKEFYEATKKDFEVVFVSSDRSEDEMLSYFREQGGWVAVPYGDAFIQELKGKYGIRGIPTLVIVNDNGEPITAEGRRDVESKGPSVVNEWKKKWTGDKFAAAGEGQKLGGDVQGLSDRELRLRAAEARMQQPQQ